MLLRWRQDDPRTLDDGDYPQGHALLPIPSPMAQAHARMLAKPHGMRSVNCARSRARKCQTGPSRPASIPDQELSPFSRCSGLPAQAPTADSPNIAHIELRARADSGFVGPAAQPSDIGAETGLNPSSGPWGARACVELKALRRSQRQPDQIRTRLQKTHSPEGGRVLERTGARSDFGEPEGITRTSFPTSRLKSGTPSDPGFHSLIRRTLH